MAVAYELGIDEDIVASWSVDKFTRWVVFLKKVAKARSSSSSSPSSTRSRRRG